MSRYHADSINSAVNTSGQSRLRPTKPNRQLYVYHWDRILMALVALLLLVAALTYVASQVFFDNEPPALLPDPTIQLEPATVVQSQSTTANDESDAQAPLQSPVIADNDLAMSAPEPETPESTHRDPSTLDTRPEELLATGVAPPADTRSPTENPVTDQLASATAADTETHSYRGEPAFSREYVEIVSPDIARFVLSSGVKELEPVGSLQDVEIPEDSPARLYAYSTLTNRKDEHLKYIWKHQNRVVSTVNVGVWSDHWRSYSSKLLEQRLAGDWLVELRDSDNRLLAKAGFKYEPPAAASR